MSLEKIIRMIIEDFSGYRHSTAICNMGYEDFNELLSAVEQRIGIATKSLLIKCSIGKKHKYYVPAELSAHEILRATIEIKQADITYGTTNHSLWRFVRYKKFVEKQQKKLGSVQ